MQDPEWLNWQCFEGGRPAEERNGCQHCVDIWAQKIFTDKDPRWLPVVGKQR